MSKSSLPLAAAGLLLAIVSTRAGTGEGLSPLPLLSMSQSAWEKACSSWRQSLAFGGLAAAGLDQRFEEEEYDAVGRSCDVTSGLPSSLVVRSSEDRQTTVDFGAALEAVGRLGCGWPGRVPASSGGDDSADDEDSSVRGEAQPRDGVPQEDAPGGDSYRVECPLEPVRWNVAVQPEKSNIHVSFHLSGHLSSL